MKLEMKLGLVLWEEGGPLINRRDVDVMQKMESDKKVNNYAVYDGIIINHYINI